VSVRHAQMVRAVATTRHDGTAAEQRRDLVHLAERPVTAPVVELEQRAWPHLQQTQIWGRWLLRPDRRFRCGARWPHMPIWPRLHLEMFFHAAWQQLIVAQPHYLSAYRRARAVQPSRNLRGRCFRPKADEQEGFLGGPGDHTGTSQARPANWASIRQKHRGVPTRYARWPRARRRFEPTRVSRRRRAYYEN